MKWYYYIITIAVALAGMSAVFTFNSEHLGAKPAEPTLDETIATLYAKYGEYIQVTSDGRLLVKGTEVTEATLSSKLPAGVKIDVYNGPQGNGYQIVRETATATISTGYGGEALSRTYTIPKQIVTASTTP